MITFILNNKTITTPEHSGMTLLDFIRYEQRLTGTKIGCREGDCAACTVLVGTLNNDHIEYQSITSCISPLGNASPLKFSPNQTTSGLIRPLQLVHFGTLSVNSKS